MKPRNNGGGLYYGEREVCPCKTCCSTIPGRAVVVARQRAAFKKRFTRITSAAWGAS